MGLVLKHRWYYLALAAVSHCLLKDTVQMKTPKSSVDLREGMVLDCLCPWTGHLTMVSWTKKPNPRPVAIYHPVYGTNYTPPYDGRVEFLKSTPMDGSISILNVTEADIGHYHCSLQTYPHGSWTKDTLVRKAVLTSTFSVQPDTELMVTENASLTIRCDQVYGGQVYRVTIEKLDTEDGSGHIIATCQKLDGGTDLSHFSSRGTVNCSDALDVSLHLTNIVKDDQGLYQCNFSTDTSVRTTTILLTTFSAHEFEGFRHMPYVYVGGGVVGLVVLMILLLTWISRQKKKREEYRIKLQSGRRQLSHHDGIYDRMKKATRSRDKEIYANFHIVRAHDKLRQKRSGSTHTEGPPAP